MPSEVFRGGLEMMLEGSEPEAMIPTLESVMQTRLSELAQAHRMIIEGVLSTQAGKKPVEIVEAVRQVAGRRDHGFHG
jgi:flagellar motor component MotA